jgi:type VI secretion system secreted protein Hcp
MLRPLLFTREGYLSGKHKGATKIGRDNRLNSHNYLLLKDINMPMPCYVSITGEKQQKIKGSSEVQGHKEKILVQGVEHLIDIPKSQQTGLPVGKRIHQGMTLTKEVDMSSPLLFQALNEGEQLKEVVLQFYRITKEGKEENYYSIKLENAALVSIRTWVPNVLLPDFKQMGHMEDVVMTYRKITWTWHDGGIESTDDWMAPVSV